jgi:hypothetical protein
MLCGAVRMIADRLYCYTARVCTARFYIKNPMIRTTLILMAALGLTISATALQAANIQILSLPFNITAPGNYVLTGNFNYSGSPAINITGPFSGPVVLNLKGHTINGITKQT